MSYIQNNRNLTECVFCDEMAKEVLKDLIYDEQRALSVESIQKTVCEYFGIKMQDIKARKRTRDIAFPRQVAMFLSKTLTDSSLSDIGKNFGAAFSAAVNIAEGAAKRGVREFRRYLDISLGSLSELCYAFLLARDLGYLSVQEWEALNSLRDRAGKVTWKLYRSLGRRN